MPAKRSVALALAALLALSAGAAAGAHGDHAPDHAQDAGPPDDRGDEADQADANANDSADPPEAAYFGLCTAWGNVPSQAASAGPFAALSDALCEDVSHPSEDHAEAPQEAGPPDHAGPPS